MKDKVFLDTNVFIYTKDMSDGQIIENALHIVNIFHDTQVDK